MALGTENAWRKARSIENDYARKLRSIAKVVGQIINGFPDPVNDPGVVDSIQRAMSGYADLIEPWATAVGGRMVAEVNRQDERAWNAHSRAISRGLANEIATAPTGRVLRERLDAQVGLIKSLPIEAGQRVHKLTLEGITQGTRAAEISKMIQAGGQVSASRATLIARTEVARTASMLTQVRAESIGAYQFIWRTAHDSDVRPSHREMEGRVCDWRNPPTLSDGTTTLPGQIYNCRCYGEVIAPDF